MTTTGAYDPPNGQLSLRGPVERPEIGALPIRGDLAHIALADRYFVAHYVIPQPRTVGAGGATLLRHPRDGAQAVVELAAGAAFEALDYAGEWCWGCCGPDGPAGYLRIRQIA